MIQARSAAAMWRRTPATTTERNSHGASPADRTRPHQGVEAQARVRTACKAGCVHLIMRWSALAFVTSRWRDHGHIRRVPSNFSHPEVVEFIMTGESYMPEGERQSLRSQEAARWPEGDAVPGEFQSRLKRPHGGKHARRRFTLWPTRASLTANRPATPRPPTSHRPLTKSTGITWLAFISTCNVRLGAWRNGSTDIHR